MHVSFLEGMERHNKELQSRLEDILKYLETCNDDTAVRFSAPMPVHVLEQAETFGKSKSVCAESDKSNLCDKTDNTELGKCDKCGRELLFSKAFYCACEEMEEEEPTAEECLEWLFYNSCEVGVQNLPTHAYKDGHYVVYTAEESFVGKTPLEAIRDAMRKEKKV